MSRIDDYRKTLTSLDDWEPFLLRESGLPGPRGNLELAAAVSELGSADQFAPAGRASVLTETGPSM